jgi:hypothetical protein
MRLEIAYTDDLTRKYGQPDKMDREIAPFRQHT